MSQILKTHYLCYSAVGSVAQTGQILERLSDAAYLVEVKTQHGEDVNTFFRVASLSEIASWRLYSKQYHMDNAVEEITEAYNLRVEAEKEAADKVAAEKLSDEANELKPEQN
jgi:hypothetical protein